MSELEVIQSALQRASRRRRWQRAWRGFWQGLLAGAVIGLLALVSYKFFPLPQQVLIASGAFAGLCLLAGFISGWMRPLSMAETARWLDEQQKLQERLSTALEVSGSAGDANWKQLLVSDAAAYARRIDPRKLVPFHLPRASQWALIVLVLCAGLGFVPEFRSKAYVQKQKEKEVIRETGKQIAELTRRNLEQRTPVIPQTQQSMEAVQQLGEQLSKNPMTRTEALKDLASAAEKIKDELKELGKNSALKPLERGAREPSRAGGSTANNLQKQIDSLQKALGDKAGNPQALEKLKQDLEKAKQAAAGMPNNDSAENAAARQQLAQTLAELSKQAQQMGEHLPSLDEAIEALKANQTDMFVKDLNTALQDLEKTQEMAKMLQQLQQQAAAKLGKDLAEQLKNGEAEAAQKTLEKMVAQLKAAQTSPEQLKKLLEEVSKAIDPATQYGKVGDLLKQASGQMQQGQKPDAAQSLADAAKELEKLLQQMGDSQSLMATLDALKKAEFSIGTCTGWGQCQGPPGYKPGGKPGRGVGTWAEEESGWVFAPEQTEDRWDNSGVVRPDTDGKGHTDRGEAQVNDALVPTKVRGQITPGGQMPSITLKGVSIKGQSKIAYTEAVAAAQSEAQSAINQDQVPRAYQGAVKDYFDDLKK